MLRIMVGIFLVCACSSARAEDNTLDKYLKDPALKYGQKGYQAGKDWLARPYEPNAPARPGWSLGYPPSFSYTFETDRPKDPTDRNNWDKAQKDAFAKSQAEEKKRMDDWYAQQRKQAEESAKNEQRNREAQSLIERNRQRVEQVTEEIDYNERTGNVARVSPDWDGPVISDTPGYNLNPPRPERDPFLIPTYKNPSTNGLFGPTGRVPGAGGFGLQRN